jgi:hypothetical protein
MFPDGGGQADLTAAFATGAGHDTGFELAGAFAQDFPDA